MEIVFTKEEVKELVSDIALANLGDQSGYIHLGYTLKNKIEEIIKSE